jgi:hypothetical protein
MHWTRPGSGPATAAYAPYGNRKQSAWTNWTDARKRPLSWCHCAPGRRSHVLVLPSLCCKVLFRGFRDGTTNFQCPGPGLARRVARSPPRPWLRPVTESAARHAPAIGGVERCAMRDYQARLEKLRTDAAECRLICDLATDKAKRDLFDRLATHLTVLADQVEMEMLSRKPTST